MDFTLFPIEDYSWTQRLQKDLDIVNFNGKKIDVFMVDGDYCEPRKVIENGKIIKLLPCI